MLIQLVDVAKNIATSVVPVTLSVPRGNFVLLKTNDDDATVSTFYHYEAA